MLLLFVVPMALAQTAAPLAAKVDVKIVNVDVAAIDENGQPVTDLKADDFDVLEDGQPVTITNFMVVRNTERALESRSDLENQFRRRLILVVDNNYIEKRDRNVALDKLDEFIAQTFDGSYEWAVGMIGQQFELMQPFTTDKQAIHQAVAKIRKTATTAFREDMDRSGVGDPMSRSGGFDASAAFESRERTKRNERSMAFTVRGLVEASQAFTTTPGKKMMVLLTGGMDLNTAFGGSTRGADRELQDTQDRISKMIDAAVREANAAHMSIHVLNAAPFQSAAAQHGIENRSSGLNRSITASSDMSDLSTPFRLASGTGGLYFASNKVENSYKAVNAASSSFYLLGYTPPHGDDGKYHKIYVRVKRPGVRVSHRQGYLDLTTDQRLEQLLRLRISLLQPAKAIPVTVKLETPPAVEGKPVVSVLAALPMSKVTLLPNEGRYAGRVHIYLSIFDAKGNNVGFHHKTQDVAFTEAQRASALADDFRYRLNVRLDRGEFTFAVTLRDELSNEIGTAVQKLRL